MSCFDRFARVAGALVLAMGTTVLVRWATNLRILESFYPGWVTMKANAAFALVLCGASLLMHGPGQARAPVREPRSPARWAR